MLPTFRELHAAYTANGFGSTNEQIECLRDLIADRTFEKGGGICSAGEVPLLVLLPKCQEVICVDHSYRSLAVAWCKILLLDSLGPQEFLKLLEGTWENFLRHCEKVFVQAPQEIQEWKPKPSTYNSVVSWHPQRSPSIPRTDYEAIQRSFRFSSEEELRQVCAKLDRLTILHGDLSDLPADLDLLYVSNVLQHSGRNGTPRADSFAKYLKADGVILRTGNTTYDEQTPKELKRLKKCPEPSIMVASCSWAYLLEIPVRDSIHV